MHPELPEDDADVAESDLGPPGEEDDCKQEVQQVEEDCSEDVEAVQRLDWALVFAFVFNLSVGHVAFKH